MTGVAVQEGLDLSAGLADAVVAGDVMRLDKLVAMGGNVHGLYQGTTLLHMAVYYRHLAIAQRLVEHGLPVDVYNYRWVTPLNRAIKNGDLKMARLLLDLGAEPNHPGEFGRVPLTVAADVDHVLMPEILRLLVGRGADLHASDTHQGKTPLHHAMHRGHLANALCLMQMGADLNAMNKEGQTPLEMADQKVAHAFQGYLASLSALDCIGQIADKSKPVPLRHL